MNPTPVEAYMGLADAVQQAVGAQRSVAPRQEPMTDTEVEKLKQLVDEQFKLWR